MVQTCGVSDHHVQIVNFDHSPLLATPRVYQIRAFRKCDNTDWDHICEALHTAPWHVMSIFDNINDKWCFFYSILSNCLDTFIPLKTVRSKKIKTTYTLVYQ